MSKLRSINTHFWQDNFVIDLDPIEKLLFLYLLSNPQTNMLGIYELHVRRISFDTGIDKDMVLKIFDRFTEAEKVKYKEGYVILQNFIKNQSYNKNMQTSAVNSWNDLPLSIREDSFCEPIVKGLKGFGKGSKPITEIEDELEKEKEEENEKEKPAKPDSEGVDIPEYSEWWRYAESKAYHPDYSQHLFDSLLSRGWCNKDDQPIKDWQAYLRMMFKYQRAWIEKQKHQPSSTGRDYEPSYYQSLD